MQVKHIRCMELPKGVPIPHFDTMKEVLAHVKGGELQVVDLLNKYGRQKDSLVNAREWLSEEVAKFFPVLDRKTGKPVVEGDEKANPETESNHLDRFATAAIHGKVTANGLTIAGKDDKEKVASVWNYLQTLIDKHEPFAFDLNSATRVGKAKKAPVYAVNAATNIINNHNEAVWIKKFTEGYEAKGYGRVEPIAFAPFNVPLKGTAEEQQKTREANIVALAWAIDAVEQQKRANTAQKEYV